MDLFGPIFVKSLSKKSYCLVITDDYTRFSWVFFLASKDETPSILKTFIIGLENLFSIKVKIIRCDNRTELKNSDLNQFCEIHFSLFLFGLRQLTLQNRVLVTKPHNKTPYELLHGRLPSIGFIRPFGCPVTILNTLDPLGKFQRKVDEGFLVGYSVCSKEFRVFNSRTHIVQDTLHVNFMENKPTVAGSGPAWLFDIDSLSQTMNYHPVITENQSNTNAGFQDTEKAGEEGTQTYVLFPVLSDGSTNSQNNNKDAHADGKRHDDDIQKSVSPDIHSSSSGAQTRKQGDKTENKDKGKSPVVTITGFRDLNTEFEEYNNNSSNGVNVASSSVSTAGQHSIDNTNDFSAAGPSNAAMPNLEDLSHDADDVGAEADINNLESIISTMNYHPVLAENQTNSNAGFQDTEKAREEGTHTYVLLPVLSDGSTNPKNNKDAHTDGKEHDDIQKSVSPDIHSSSCGDQAREKGDKAENKDKGKSPVVTIIGFRDLNEEFTECINNSSNGVNAAGSLVSTVGLNFTNSTNDFSAAGPSNAAMPNLEDLSQNADDVGAEADINNMESIISVSPIPITRIHKDHPTSQIIGDPSSTTQTRSMARGVRDQGGIS
nr:hypothetical protein [Tanacetum cinerariifolium]